MTGPTRLRRLGALVVTLLALAAPAVAQEEFEKTILTGGPTGTYIQIGRDIAGLMQECGYTLNVLESAGSLENLLGVRKRPFTQFGIVQSDVLEYLRTFAADDPAIARTVRGVRIAFPLYNEEVHILGRRDIESLADLEGRRVAIGAENSGTFLTASLMLDIADVTPAERVTINAQESLDRLLAGEIDAFFYVAGAPTAIFQSDAIDPAAYHLVPIEDPALQAVYLPTTIPAGTYPFQSGPVDVIAVKAVLMTYEYDPRRNPYHAASCRAVSDVANLVVTRFDELLENGHPKWQEVDLADVPPGWDISGCVNAGLEPTYRLECPSATMAGAGSSIESEANDAYRRNICAVMGC